MERNTPVAGLLCLVSHPPTHCIHKLTPTAPFALLVPARHLTCGAAVRAREEALAARVDEPFERREGACGEMIDMRPVALRIKVAEREYSFYVSALCACVRAFDHASLSVCV